MIVQFLTTTFSLSQSDNEQYLRDFAIPCISSNRLGSGHWDMRVIILLGSCRQQTERILLEAGHFRHGSSDTGYGAILCIFHQEFCDVDVVGYRICFYVDSGSHRLLCTHHHSLQRNAFLQTVGSPVQLPVLHSVQLFPCSGRCLCPTRAH